MHFSMNFRLLSLKDCRAGSSDGMTLIDMAIFMTVLGLMAVPIIQTYNNWKESKGLQDTQDRLAKISQAIDGFYYENERYPCPSDISLATTNPNFGHENCPPPPTALAPPAALEGGIPFVDLKIPADISLDGWGNRLKYVVSDKQRVKPFDKTAGALTIQYPDPKCDSALPLLAPRSAVHYILLSTGVAGVGGWTASGTPTPNSCPVNGNSLSEKQNCDADGNISSAASTTFLSDTCRSDVPGLGYFDDVLSYRDAAPSRIWVYNSTNSSDIVTMAGNVGINNSNPQVPLDVAGNILADDPGSEKGRVYSDSLCDVSGLNCFGPRDITGIMPTMTCNNKPQGTALRGFKSAAADCSGTYPPGTGRPCPGGQYVTGFDTAGNITCAQ